MVDRLPPPSVIRGRVVDGTGRPLGRVIGVIYSTSGVDVLVESGRWFRRRGARYSMERISRTPDGAVVVDTRPENGRAACEDAEYQRIPTPTKPAGLLRR